MRRTDYEEMSTRYDHGRSLSDDDLTEWRRILTAYLSPETAHPVLDLGAGTGIFSVLLSRWFGCEVFAVEPSEGMRQEGISKTKDPRIRWIAGSAEQIPLATDACGAAWLSVSLHHFNDLAKAAQDVRRVLRDRSPVLIRQLFSGRVEHITWARFFPEAAALSSRRHPTVEVVVDAFAAAGFRAERLERVSQTTSASRTDFVKRVGVRADSTLAAIDDDAFARGMNRLRDWADSEPDEPVVDRLDLLVLR